MPEARRERTRRDHGALYPRGCDVFAAELERIQKVPKPYRFPLFRTASPILVCAILLFVGFSDQSDAATRGLARLDAGERCDIVAGDPGYPEIYRSSIYSMYPKDREFPYGFVALIFDKMDAVKAIEHCQAAVKKYPNAVSFQYFLARGYLRNGQAERAYQLMTRAAQSVTWEARSFWRKTYPTPVYA